MMFSNVLEKFCLVKFWYRRVKFWLCFVLLSVGKVTCCFGCVLCGIVLVKCSGVVLWKCEVAFSFGGVLDCVILIRRSRTRLR